MNRALVVGIGDYGRLGQPLPGCANDLAGWRDRIAPTLNVAGDYRGASDRTDFRDSN